MSDFASFAIESLSDGAFLISKDASLVYVNRAACKQLGYTKKEELLRMRVMDFNPHLTQEIWDSVWGVTVRDKIQTIEVEHLTKYGRTLPCPLRFWRIILNYMENNTVVRLLVTSPHASEPKSLFMQSEERFRALTENTSDWIWEVDQSFVFTYSQSKS